MFIHNLLIAFALFFLASCSTSKYVYHLEPTPIKKGITKYAIKEVKVTLELGNGAIEGDTTFSSESQLKKQFVDSLTKHLKEQGLEANSANQHNVVDVSVKINYLRRFNWGGKALNKPEVSHTVVVQKDGKKIASFDQNKYTTKYGYLKDAAVNIEIAAFQWDSEDEKQDVDLISELIIEDLKELGD